MSHTKPVRQNSAWYFMQELVDRLNLERLKIDARLQGSVTSPYHENGWVVTSDRSGGLTENFTRLPAKAQFFALHVNGLVNGGWNLEAFRVTHNGHFTIEAVFHSPDPPYFEEPAEETVSQYVGRNLLRLRLNPYQPVTRTRINYFLDVERALNPDLIIEPVVAAGEDIYTKHSTIYRIKPISIPPFFTLTDLMEMGSNPKAPIPEDISKSYIRGMESRAFPFQRVLVAEEGTKLVSVWQNAPRLWARIFLQQHRPILETAIEMMPEDSKAKVNRLKEEIRQILNQTVTPRNRIIRRLADSKRNYSPVKVAAIQDRLRWVLEVSERNIDPTHLLPQPQ